MSNFSVFSALALATMALAGPQALALTPPKARSLKQLGSGLPEITEQGESLENACGIESIQSLLSSMEGVVCVLAASVVGQFEVLEYTVNVPQAVVESLTFEIIIEPFFGNVAMQFARVDGDALNPTQIATWESGNSDIFVPELEAGQHTIVLTSQSPFSVFSMRVEIFQSGITASSESTALLELVFNKCCSAEDPCTGVLAQIDNGNVCDSPGNHCNADGHITHLDLSQSNMHCTLLDVLEPLGPLAINVVQDLQLNDNDISGSLDDPNVLAVLATWSSLVYLELGNLPGVTGSIPSDCPVPFDKLVHLGLSDTNVGGALPACLLQTVHQLEISRTQIRGAFPPFESENLRYILADQVPGSEAVFTGAFPTSLNLDHVHVISFNNQQFTGVVNVPINLQALFMRNNAIDDMVFPDTVHRLELVDMTNNNLSGAIDAALARADALVALLLSGNALTEMPRAWPRADAATRIRLHVFDASDNNIQGALNPVYGAMPYLRELKLANNGLTGTLDAFSAALPAASVLSVLDLSNNALEGTLFFPDLAQLAAFSSARFEVTADGSWDKTQLHLFDMQDNDLEGPIEDDLLEAFRDQKQSGVNLSVLLKGNRLECPTTAKLESFSLNADEIDGLGCGPQPSSGGGVSAGRILLILFLAILVPGLAFAGYVVYRRRKSGRGFLAAERSAGASEYASEAEAGRTGGDVAPGGTTGGGFLSGTGSGKGFSSHVGDPRSTGRSFLPSFLSRGGRRDGTGAGVLGKQYVDSTGYEEGANPAYFGAANRAAGAPALPVSGLDSLTVRTGAREGVEAGELASPISELSDASGAPPGNTLPATDGLDVKDGSDSSDDAERNMRVTFNAAFAPGEAP